MSATEAAVRDFQQFVGGEWTASAGGATFDDYDPFTGDVVARVAAGTREDARRAIECRCRRVRGLVEDAAGGEAAHLPEGRRRAREPGRGRRRLADSRDRRDVRLLDVPAPFRAGTVPPGGSARLRADRRGDPVGRGQVRNGSPPAGRSRRRDRSVECRADPLGPVDRCPARTRQRGRAQAVGALAVQRRPPLGRDLLRGRTAGRSPERHRACPRRGGGDRRRARREPCRAPDQLHRLDGHGPEARRGRGPPAEARRPRAGRLQPADRPRRTPTSTTP